MKPAARPDLRAMLLDARAALARGDRSEALRVLDRAAGLFPHIAAVQVEHGNLLLAERDLAAAEAAYRRAIAADDRDVAARVGLGNVLRERDLADEAIDTYRKATELAPALDAVWYNLGAALREVGRFDDAIAAYDRALALAPAKAATHYNRANALTAAGRFDAALVAYDTALRLQPAYPEAVFSRGLTRLLAGDFAGGWDDSEARWRARTFATPYRFPHLPAWAGESLAGRRLLVWGEQGIGDEIRFLSVLGEVVAEAVEVVWVGEPRLRGLVARSFPALRLPPPDADEAVAAEGCDLQVPVGSLPRFRRRSLADFPSPPRPWLTADAAQRDRWSGWLATLGTGPRIGISWRTGRNARRKQARYAGLDAWGGFLAEVRAQWVCLQYDACDDDLAAFADRFGVRVHVPAGLDRRDDFEALAGLDAALDAVISAPNTVADLAGALGVPCRVVLHAPHWPWGVWPEAGAGAQPWYPNLGMLDARAQGGWTAAFATAGAWITAGLR